MRRLRLHPLVYDDIDEALAYTRERFGPRQVESYARLIIGARLTLRRHPTIGLLPDDLGSNIRVFCIAQGRITAPHGYIYKVQQDGALYIARLVHLARCLPISCPEVSERRAQRRGRQHGVDRAQITWSAWRRSWPRTAISSTSRALTAASTSPLHFALRRAGT